jgi:ATP-binding cassette subfamily C protein
MQATGKDLLHQLIRRSWSAIACAWFFSFFLSVLQLIVPLHMMQVYDRVMSSRSIDTLLMLTIVAVGGLIVLAALDYIRSKLYMALGEIVARRLSIPTLQAAVSATLGNPSPQGQQAIRDLNDLRLFISGSAITVPFDVAWVPLYLVVLFLLHPVYGLVALAGLDLVVAGIAAQQIVAVAAIDLVVA